MSLTPDLQKIHEEIRGYALSYGLDPFDIAFEIVSSDQINQLAAREGFPVRYPHWRFGMNYDQLSKSYEWGLSKIYEMVINNDPAYAYLMSSNPVVDQKTVMAHVYGHVDFFKNNTWFSRTNRKMLDEMANHAVRIRSYMDRHGQDAVEHFIDRCLSLENLIDSQLPFQDAKQKPLEGEEQAQETARLPSGRAYMDRYINPKEFLDEQKKKAEEGKKREKRFPPEPEKDVLHFLLLHAPLEDWERETLTMVRDEAYYFVPQMQTKILNEGWASYWHAKILTEKALRDSEVIDFADHHAGVLAMSPGRINPYKVGVELLRDIEDRWNRGAFGKEFDDCDDLVKKAKWDKKLGLGRQKIFEVRRVCNDVTFLDQYLTPEFVERFQLYTYEFNRRTGQYEITERDFKKVKEKLLSLVTNMGQPQIYVQDGNFQNRGELLLWHKHLGVDLDPAWARETLANLHSIWKRPTHIETMGEGAKRRLSFDGTDFSDEAVT